MISIYTSSLLVTVVIAGISTAMIAEARKGPPEALNAGVLTASHEFALRKAETITDSAIMTVDSATEMGNGPYGSSDLGLKSYLVIDANPSPTATGPVVAVVSWLTMEDPALSQRVRSSARPPTEDTEVSIAEYEAPAGSPGRETTWSPGGSSSAWMTFPGMEIPEGSVLMVTKIQDGEA